MPGSHHQTTCVATLRSLAPLPDELIGQHRLTDETYSDALQEWGEPTMVGADPERQHSERDDGQVLGARRF